MEFEGNCDIVCYVLIKGEKYSVLTLLSKWKVLKSNFVYNWNVYIDFVCSSVNISRTDVGFWYLTFVENVEEFL